MTDRLTLTPEQLQDLADGKVRPAAQVKRLRAKGIPFMWDGKGPVKVLLSALDRHPAAKKAPREGFAAEPDFSMFGRQG